MDTRARRAWAAPTVPLPGASRGNRAPPRIEPVAIGRRNDRMAEVLSGPAEGARVVSHPAGEVLSDGARVRPAP